MNDTIEFYLNNSLLTRVKSSQVPDRDDLICIQRKVYKVIGKSFVLDYSDQPVSQREMNCILNLELNEDQTIILPR